MDARQAELLQEIDPAELGHRIRAARVAKGLTQGDLAGETVSIGYVSRIESGARRPNAKVLEQLAARLGTSVEELLSGVAPRELDEIRLELDYAELSLESGEAREALTRSDEALALARKAGLAEFIDRGRYLRGRALEALGEVDDAIIELETLIAEGGTGLLRIKAGMALSRNYRESGDFAMAIEIGERLLDELAGTPLARCDESVQLSVTVAAAYHERGDTRQAVRLCRRALLKAEELDSPIARASAYWNASLFESERGSVHDAVPLAARALALLGEGQDARNLARLRLHLGTMQLELDPPQVEEARRNLEQSAEELAASSAGAVDRARNQLGLARIDLLRGQTSTALAESRRVYDAVRGQSPLVAAYAKTIEGQAWAAQGQPERALGAYQQAVLALTGLGADRSAAQLWFELAGLLEELDQFDAARSAYRSAAASAGLRSQVRLPDLTSADSDSAEDERSAASRPISL